MFVFCVNKSSNKTTYQSDTVPLDRCDGVVKIHFRFGIWIHPDLFKVYGSACISVHLFHIVHHFWADAISW